MIVDGVALSYGRTVGVDDPEHCGNWRLGTHHAAHRHVPVAEVRFRRQTADLGRIYARHITTDQWFSRFS